MCGITGFFNAQPHHNNPAFLQKMVEKIKFRGPDDQGFWHQAEKSLGLGHVRLSIVDLTPTGHQPMISDSGRYIVVFNGEIYNFLDLKKQFSGKIWRGTSDTEILCAMIDKFGFNTSLDYLEGMFALAVYDKEEDLLYLARDRFGEKPLYYYHLHNHFYFASDIAALRLITTDLSHSAINYFMQYNYIPAPHSIYENCYKLPPGHYMVVSRETMDINQYYNKDKYYNQAKKPVDFQDICQGTKTLLQETIKNQMLADVPLGAFLSGGVDSSLIVALMQEQRMDKIQTFTIGFDDKEFDESPIANIVSNILGTQHHCEMMNDKQILNIIEQLPRIYNEPFADSSQVPMALLAQITSKSVKVALSGDAGDELFMGYNRYKIAQQFEKYNYIPSFIKKTIGNISSLISEELYNKILGQLSILEYKNIGYKIKKLEKLLLLNNDNLYENIINHQNKNQTLIDHKNQAFPYNNYHDKLENIFRYNDLNYYLPDDIFVKTDRATMAFGLEGRVPFCNHNLFEYIMQYNQNNHYYENKQKAILKNILKNYIPEKYINRKKMGFGIPINKWLNGICKDWAENLLSKSVIKKHNIFEYEKTQKIWKNQQNGQYDPYYIWNILMLQAWLEDNKLG